MKRFIPVVILPIIALALSGCGGGSSTMQTRFINDSPAYASNGDLESWWTEAQQKPIFVNAITVYLNPAIPPDVKPPDARALSLQPENIEFAVMPNTPDGFPCPG